MRRKTRLLFVLSVLLGAMAGVAIAAEDPFQALVRPTDALSPEEECVRLKVPEGFSVQLFAAEPQINKPINFTFDARGRLWVSSTTEYPFAAPTNRWVDAIGSRVRDSRDAIKILEDTDGDGRVDKVTDFADGLNIPVGVLPYGNGCIAWSVPNIWYFEDIDGDGTCDRRTVLFGPLGWEKDVHGNIASLRLAPDGWVYATHGFNNISRIEVQAHRLNGRTLGDPGTVIEINSGNTFRFRPDGSAVELWAGGQVNPFGLCFDSFGQIYTADCHSDPITQILRGARYPSFGKPHDGLGFAPVMCPHRHGSTGLCGLIYVNRGIWGADWDDTMLLGNVVTSRINRDRVTFTGGTARANEQPDFLVSEDPWFRPVDLQIGPDGALYVADFYNKIIGHYEVDRNHPGRDRTRGRIWRIVKPGTKPPRPFNKTEELAQRWRWTENARASWSDAVRNVAFATLNDASVDGRVRLAIAEGVSVNPAPGQLPKLAEAIQKTPEADLALHHQLLIALRNQLRLPGEFDQVAAVKLPEADLLKAARSVGNVGAARWLHQWLERQTAAPTDLSATVDIIARELPMGDRASFVSLLRQRFVKPGNVNELLRTLRNGFSAKGQGDLSALKDWAHELADAKLRRLEQGGVAQWEVIASGDQPSPWGMDERSCRDGQTMKAISSLPMPRGPNFEQRTGVLRSVPFVCPEQLSFWVCGHRGAPNAEAHQKNFIRLINESGTELMRAYPPRNDTARRVDWKLNQHAGKSVWLEIVDGDDGRAYAWLAVGRLEPSVVAMELPMADDRVLEVAELIETFADAALAERLGKVTGSADLAEQTRLKVFAVLARFPSMRERVAAEFKLAPSRLQLRYAESLMATRAGAGDLVEMAPARLLAEPMIRQRIASLNDPQLTARFEERVKNLPPAAPELEALLQRRLKAFEKLRSAGRLDASAGAKVFAANCAVCHRIGTEGGLIGPQLDGAKNRGAERLCEDILDPNRAVDPAFRAVTATLKDDSAFTGLVRREDDAALVLADALGQEHTLLKRDVASRQAGVLSLMPSNFAEIISETDFNNLIAWLLTR